MLGIQTCGSARRRPKEAPSIMRPWKVELVGNPLHAWGSLSNALGSGEGLLVLPLTRGRQPCLCRGAEGPLRSQGRLSLDEEWEPQQQTPSMCWDGGHWLPLVGHPLGHPFQAVSGSLSRWFSACFVQPQRWVSLQV